MTNNDILRRIRYLFDFSDTKMIAIFKLVEFDVSPYHYAIGKLATNRTLAEFQFHSRTLRRSFINNNLVVEELDHMEINIENDVEYYCAHRWIGNELKEHIK